MPIHGKALTLILASSGMRVGESVRLKLSDIEFDRDPVRIKIRAKYTKTGKRRITFISPEAKEAVEEWSSEYVSLSLAVLKSKKQFLEAVFSKGKEGIVLKKLKSVYSEGKKHKD